MEKDKSAKIAVFDFFSGCGGTSSGFKKAGMDIAFALDIDKDAQATFKKNFTEAVFCKKSILDLTSEDIEPVLNKYDNHLRLFCGCAPCQPFTKQQTEKKKRDQRAPLLREFGKLIIKYKPDYVFVENVPGLQKVDGKYGPFPDFKKDLANAGYQYDFGVVAAQDYGVAQKRRRFIFLASKHGKIKLPESTHGPNARNPFNTVRDTINDLPPIKAGEAHPEIPNHQSAGLSEINLTRITNTPEDGGGRNDWPEHLKLLCHTKIRKKTGKPHSGHTDVYGRLFWDKPSTGLTTKCISLSNGRFGHPEQNRAISVREAARLQGFDDDFIFEGNLQSTAKQVGNAVPVFLAQAFGKYVIAHYSKLMYGDNNG